MTIRVLVLYQQWWPSWFLFSVSNDDHQGSCSLSAMMTISVLDIRRQYSGYEDFLALVCSQYISWIRYQLKLGHTNIPQYISWPSFNAHIRKHWVVYTEIYITKYGQQFSDAVNLFTWTLWCFTGISLIFLDLPFFVSVDLSPTFLGIMPSISGLSTQVECVWLRKKETYQKKWSETSISVRKCWQSKCRKTERKLRYYYAAICGETRRE